MSFTNQDKLKCAQREIGKRRKNYAHLVEKRNMSQEKADREIALMEAIRDDYERLARADAERVEVEKRKQQLQLDPIDISGPELLKNRPVLMDQISRMVTEGTARGDLPTRHLFLVDDSTVLWIGPESGPFAFALFYETYPKVAWFDMLYVDPQHRGYGYGTILFDGFEQCLRRSGFRFGELGTALDNHVLQRIARRAGWVERALTMERRL